MTRLGFFAIAAAALSVLQTASAHFQLTYPPTRGFNEDNEPTAPCGGFNTVGSRTQFPLQNGFVQINSGHTDYTFQVKLITNSNPSTNDFNNGTVVAEGKRAYPADACLPIALDSVAGAAAGTNATLQIVYNGGDGALYQCTDVTLAENPSGFNQSQCVNADGSNPTGADGSSPTGASTDESAASTLRVAGGVMLAAVAAAFSIAT